MFLRRRIISHHVSALYSQRFWYGTNLSCLCVGFVCVIILCVSSNNVQPFLAQCIIFWHDIAFFLNSIENYIKFCQIILDEMRLHQFVLD